MYIQRNKSRYKSGKEYITPLLCAKYREGTKVKTRVLANLSSYTDEQILLLENALKHSKGEKMILEKEIEIEKCVDFGYFFLIQTLMKHLRIDEVLQKVLPEEHVANIRAMIIGKLLTAGSKLSIFNLLQRNNTLSVILNIDKRLKVDDLYSSLGILDAYQSRIDSKWIHYHKIKGKSIYLYDITSTYFEGRENELAAFGYNRDKKAGKMQICIGLITDSNGFPLKTTVFKGNVTDTLTVEEQILDLQKQTGIDNLIFVGDRGMQIIFHTENDASLQSSKLQFITGLTHAQIKKLIATQAIDLTLFNKEVAEITDGNYRYILSINPELEERDKYFLNYHKNKLDQNLEHIRNSWKDRHIKNLENQITLSKEAGKKRKLKTAFSEKDLEGYKKRVNLLLAQKCTGKYYMIETIDNCQFNVKFDKEQYQTDLNLCGKYVICSNVPQTTLDKHEVRQEYKNLQKVEHGFRDLKSENISIRPVYHRKEHQTRGHVQICFWAYTIIKTMEDKIYPFLKAINEQERKQLSFNDIIAELKNIKLVEIRLGKGAHTVKYAKLNDLQKKILELFNLNPDDMIAMMNHK